MQVYEQSWPDSEKQEVANCVEFGYSVEGMKLDVILQKFSGEKQTFVIEMVKVCRLRAIEWWSQADEFPVAADQQVAA